MLPNIRGAEMRILGLEKPVFLSYNTTPAEEEEKALEMGVRFPALKG